MEDYGYIIVGNKKEIDEFERELDFEKEDLVIKERFNGLHPSLQKIVKETLKKLVDEQEHEGYNLRQIVEWMRVDGLPTRQIFCQIENHQEEIGMHSWYERMTADEMQKKMDKKFMQKSMENSVAWQKCLQEFCDFCMISMELVKNGKGVIYELDIERIDENELKSLWDEGVFDQKKEWNTRRFFEKYQEIIKERNPNCKEIIKKRYAVIKNSGAYRILKMPKNKAAYRAIKQLIIQLSDLIITIDDEWISTKYKEI